MGTHHRPAKDTLHSYPVALLLHRPAEERRGKSTTKAGKSSRIRLMNSFFTAVKEECECHPDILHVDKDFAEITAIEQVWPTIKIQTCLWHLKKAITRRLRAAASSKRIAYSPNEVKVVVPKVDPNWMPKNATAPKRTVRDPFTSARTALPASFHTPHAPTSSSTTPRITLSKKSAATYLETANAPSYSPELLAEMRRLEYDEDEDDDGRRRYEGDEDGEEGGKEGGVEMTVDGLGSDEEVVETATKRRKLHGKKSMHGEVSTVVLEVKKSC